MARASQSRRTPPAGRQLVPNRIIIAGLLALGCLAAGAVQAANLVQNPDFAITGGNGKSFQFGSGCGTNCTGYGSVAGWTTSGYSFVFLPGTADSPGGEGASGNVELWGPQNGSNNGLPGAVPGGGNFIAADGSYEVSAITQQISGLVVGRTVTVSFAWAGAQQYSFTGATTESWTVDLGSSPAQSTTPVSLASHGFSGWMSQSFTFVATSSSELLSFLAVGTPGSSVPPFSLLTNVSVTVPEPASLTIIATGLTAIGGIILSRRRKLAPRASAASAT